MVRVWIMCKMILHAFKKKTQKTPKKELDVARPECGDQDRIPTLSTINKVLSALGYEADLTIKKAA